MQVLIAIATVPVLFFVAALASMVVGGLVGWIVAMVFPYVIDTLNTLSGQTLTGFQMGAVLGFVGTFFRNSNSK